MTPASHHQHMGDHRDLHARASSFKATPPLPLLLGHTSIPMVQAAPAAIDAQEGSGVGQLKDSTGEEPFEYPPRGLRNDQGEPCFKHKDKVIKITKYMVEIFIDFPGGTLRSKYIDHRIKMPLREIEEVMLSDKAEDGFIRSFAFYFISTILCRQSYRFGNMKFLYSLRDVSVIPTTDFGQLALDFMREGSERHFEMIMNKPSVEDMNKPLHIGVCLPIWGIIYLDFFFDFDVIENHQSSVDYSPPRISHIKNDDFEYLALLRDISQTPYANVGRVSNAPVNPSEFLSVPHMEVINAMHVPQDLFELKPIDSNSTSINSEGLKFCANVDLDDKVKPRPHFKEDA
ncbi:hypothetical protein ZWY2020_034613 [Hordeum vulgare]|nr:hypothetical protein ZWY2020_034613 [Hordeum vulgare]